MNGTIIVQRARLKLTDVYKYFLILLALIGHSAMMPVLQAGTIYDLSILDNDQNESRWFAAIKSDNLAALKALIDSGADVNERSTRGYTPLMGAVYKGNVEAIKLLVSAGAELEAYDHLGNTPLMYAFYGAKEKAAAVELLLSFNVNTDIINDREYTPLILAALNNHCQSIKLLIESGLDIEVQGKSGGTPLMHAVENQNVAAAKLLIQQGANLETRDEWSFTPLMTAAFNNSGSMVRLLLQAGADVHARTTKPIPISLKKDWRDFFPQTVYIPQGSTALDIAKQFGERVAENILTKEGRAQ